MISGGRGCRKDRAFFGDKVWVKAHLVGKCEQFFDGVRFYLSDHFGIMSYVDVNPVYGLSARGHEVKAARKRRSDLAEFMYQCQQKDEVEMQALRQRGRESQALEQRRARERDFAELREAQQRAAKQRRSRVERLTREAFGAASLFADTVTAELAACTSVPIAPADVAKRKIWI